MKLFKVRLIDPAIEKKQLVTVYIVIAPSAKTAEQRCAAENHAAFSRQPIVEVEEWEHDSIKLMSVMMPMRKKEQTQTMGGPVVCDLSEFAGPKKTGKR